MNFLPNISRWLESNPNNVYLVIVIILTFVVVYPRIFVLYLAAIIVSGLVSFIFDHVLNERLKGKISEPERLLLAGFIGGTCGFFSGKFLAKMIY